MRDWRRYLRKHLGSITQDPVRGEQILSELAGHMEEYYEALRAEGTTEAQAFAQTCVLAGNWQELRRGILSAKQEGTIMERVKQICLPTLVTLVLAGAVLTVLIGTGARAMVWHPRQLGVVIQYVPWLLLLPVIGGIGGHLSRRAKGSGWRVYFSGLSPALAWAVVFVLVAPFAFFVNPAVAPSFKIASIFAMVISWVILPGIALGVGLMVERIIEARMAGKVLS